MPHPLCLNGKRFLPWPFSIFCFPSLLTPGALEDSPPKRPRASTPVSLKKPRAALGGVKPAIPLVCCLDLCCSPAGGDSREQEAADRKQETKPDQGPPVHKPVLRPAGQLMNPGAVAPEREAGIRPAGLGAATQPSRGRTGSEAGTLQVLSWLLECSHSQPAPRSSLRGLFSA